jgi:hypothetical protein
MIILWPLLLVAAGLVMAKARTHGVRLRGWDFFVIWGLAGALFMFSFLSGFSIGVFLFPVAAVAVLWLAANAPGREAIGFLAGAAATLLIVLVFV